MADANKDRAFYDGNGFDKLTGPGAADAYALWDKLEQMRKDEPLKGNLYEPRVNADFPNNPCLLPINLMMWPERGMDFVMLRGQPGSEWPQHTHGYGDEIYLVVGGSGIVIIDGEEYEAGLHDIFWIPAGTPHSYRTPADRTESFDIFAVNVPGVKHTMRSTYWAGPPKGPVKGPR